MKFVANNLIKQPTVKELLNKHFGKKGINYLDFREKNKSYMTEDDREQLFAVSFFHADGGGMKLWKNKKQKEEFIDTYLDILQYNRYVPITIFDSSLTVGQCQAKEIILKTLNRKFIEELSLVYEIPFLVWGFQNQTVKNYATIYSYQNGQLYDLFKDVMNHKEFYKLVFLDMKERQKNRASFLTSTDDNFQFCSKEIIEAGGCPIGISQISVVNTNIITK